MKPNHILNKVAPLILISAVLFSACGQAAGIQPGNASQPTQVPAPTQAPSQSPEAEPSSVSTQVPKGMQARELPAAVEAARSKLAKQLGLSVSDIKVVYYDAVEWPDSCLGVQTPGVMCAMVVTPGYRIILEAQGKTYEYHSDKTGNGLVQANSTPISSGDKPMLVWSLTAGGQCQGADVNIYTISYGPCGGSHQTVPFASNRSSQELDTLFLKYAAFTAETPAGQLEFNGMGKTVATPAEQRSIAEWARMNVEEASGSQSSSETGLAIAWHREGGIGGFCDDVYIYRSGFAYVSSCKGGTVTDYPPLVLEAGQLDQLYQWIDGLKSFQVEQTDPATADAMTQRLAFTGSGASDAGENQRLAMMSLAAQAAAQAASLPQPENPTQPDPQR